MAWLANPRLFSTRLTHWFEEIPINQSQIVADVFTIKLKRSHVLRFEVDFTYSLSNCDCFYQLIYSFFSSNNWRFLFFFLLFFKIINRIINTIVNTIVTIGQLYTKINQMMGNKKNLKHPFIYLTLRSVSNLFCSANSFE